MKAVSIKILKDELKHKDSKELMELCLKLARFKKENKELLTYLLFEAHDEEQYISMVKEEISVLFSEINTKSFFFIAAISCSPFTLRTFASCSTLSRSSSLRRITLQYIDVVIVDLVATGYWE